MFDSISQAVHAIFADYMAQDLRTLARANESGDRETIPYIFVAPEHLSLGELARKVIKKHYGGLRSYRDTHLAVLRRAMGGTSRHGHAELITQLLFVPEFARALYERGRQDALDQGGAQWRTGLPEDDEVSPEPVIRAALRSANAAIVRPGFGPTGPGMTEPSTTYSSSWPKTLPNPSTTSPIGHPPSGWLVTRRRPSRRVGLTIRRPPMPSGDVVHGALHVLEVAPRRLVAPVAVEPVAPEGQVPVGDVAPHAQQPERRAGQVAVAEQQRQLAADVAVGLRGRDSAARWCAGSSRAAGRTG